MLESGCRVKPLNLIIYASAILLISICAVGAINYKPLPDVIYPNYPDQIKNRTLSPSMWGDLNRFNLVVNCTLHQNISSAPVISYRSIPITLDEAKLIAKGLYGMDNPEVLDSTPLFDIVLRQTYRLLSFDGLNKVSYYTDVFEDVIHSWDEAEVRRITDGFVEALDPYLSYSTSAVRRASWVGPVHWRSIDGGSEDVIEVGVRYTWSVQGIDIQGDGGNVRVNASGEVSNSIVTKPAVRIVGEQQIVASPEDALNSFVKGWSANTALHIPSTRHTAPNNGTMVINGVRPVYYLYKYLVDSPIPILVYQIDATFIPDGGGEPVVFTDYQYVS
jgi:hypothetical protein